MKTTLFTACAILQFCATGTAQEAVAVFEGPAGGVGSITVYDPVSGDPLASPTELGGLALLPFDFAGRTQLDTFSPTRPRRFTDISGASRLRLQQGVGSLYLFARPGNAGSASYGFLLVPPTAAPRILIERPGIGAGQGRNPFLSFVALAPDGARLLVATHGEAGGDLLEVATVGSPAIVDRTAALPPLRIYPWSLALGGASGFAVSTVGVLRFDRATALDADFVTFGADPTPSWYAGQLAQSQDASHVVFTAGSASNQLHVYSVGASGPARRASATPGVVAAAGNAHDGASGPWLAVSDDGQWCAWRTTIGTSNECLIARTSAAPVAAQQLSSDAQFTDTLDEVALFAFRGPSRFVFAVGEQNPGAAPGKVDLFAADLAAGPTAQIQNLTLTSGQASAPFTAIPDLEPAYAAFLPDRSGVVIHDDSGQQGDLYVWREGQAGLQSVLSPIKEFNELEFAGPSALFAVRRDNGVRELYRTNDTFTVAPIVVHSATNGTTYESLSGYSDGTCALLETGSVGQRLERVNGVNGATAFLAGGPALFGAARGWTASGSLLCTRIQSGVYAHIAWSPSQAPVRLHTGGTSGQILPAY